MEEQKLSSLDSSVVATIYKTRNYGLFSRIHGNRDIDPSNLRKIRNSIKGGYIETNAIICALDENDNDAPLKIIDGQHRFEACKMEGLPISYVIDQSIDMKEINNALDIIIRMNTASKEWDVNGFMISEGARKNPNYVLYKELFADNKYEHEILFFILNNNADRKQIIGFPLFKEGKLEFSGIDYEYLRNRLKQLNQFIKDDDRLEDLIIGAGKRYYLKALNLLYNTENFNDKQMLYKLRTQPHMVSKCNTIDQALEQLRNIYNHGLRNNKIYIARSGREIDMIFIK